MSLYHKIEGVLWTSSFPTSTQSYIREGLFLAILLHFWLVSGGCSRTWQEQSTRWRKLRMTPSTNKNLTFCYIYASQTKIIPSHRYCFEIYLQYSCSTFLLFMLPVVPFLKSRSLNIYIRLSVWFSERCCPKITISVVKRFVTTCHFIHVFGVA